MPHLPVLPGRGLAIEVKMIASLGQKGRYVGHMLAKQIVHLPAAIGGGVAKSETG